MIPLAPVVGFVLLVKGAFECDLPSRGERRSGWPVRLGDVLPGGVVPVGVVKINAGIFIYDKKRSD